MVIEVKSATTITVIHYTGIENDTDAAVRASCAAKKGASSIGLDSAAIKEEDIELDPNSEAVELLRYKPESAAIHEGQDAVKRARTRLHETCSLTTVNV